MKQFNEAIEIKAKIERGDLSIGILAMSEVARMQDLLIASAHNGNNKAWFELGMCFYKGLISDEIAAEKAIKYFKKAAEAGYGIDAWKMYLRIAYYYSPSNVENEEVKNVIDTYISKDTSGEIALLKGYMLLKGYVYEENYLDSSKAILFAAEKGNIEAMFELYIYYHFGYGVVKNADTAVEWCLKAAENGNLRALYNMGTIYATGYGSVVKNIDTAINWYTKASESGHGKAGATLSTMYIVGEGVPKDLVKAKHFFRQACENDYDIEAEVMIEDLIEIPEDWY